MTEIFNKIKAELKRAENLHDFPSNIFEQLSILTEEAGEVAKAVNDFKFKGEPLENVKTELIQTVAMCVRMYKKLHEINLTGKEVEIIEVLGFPEIEHKTETTEDEYKGTSIEGFPPEVVEWMLENQVKQGNKADVEVFKEERAYSKIKGGFTWEDTEEKDEFCNDVINNKNFHLFFEKYPKTK